MFKCGRCNENSRRNKDGVSEKPVKVVIETMPYRHPGGSPGTQIVKEIDVCPRCVDKDKEKEAA